MELENKSLRSKLERAAKRTHDAPESTLKLLSSARSDDSGINNCMSSGSLAGPSDSNALRQSLEQKNHDYDVLKKAHARLIHKFRQVKKSVEDWKDYEARNTSTIKPRSKVIESGELLSGIKTPETTPVPLPSSTVSYQRRNHTPIVTPSAQGVRKESTDILDRSNTAQASGSDNALVISGDSQRCKGPRWEISSSSSRDTSTKIAKTRGQPHPTSSGSESSHTPSVVLASRADESSEIPKVTSGRTMKRRRAMSPQVNAHTLIRDDLHSSGTAIRPVRVKSEHGSSSPLVPDRFCALDTNQDSLDLDEVGTHITTPLKRRRMEDNVDLQSKELLLSSYRRRWKGHHDEMDVKDCIPSDMGSKTPLKNVYTDSERSVFQTDSAQPALKNPAPYARNKDALSHPTMANLNVTAAQSLISLQYSRAARQHLQNQSTTTRQDKTADTCAEFPSGACTSATQNENGPSPTFVEDGPQKMTSPTMQIDRSGEKTSMSSMPLQPLTPNLRVLPRTSDQNQPSEAHTKHQYRGSGSVSAVAEDGEEYSSESANENTIVVHKDESGSPLAVLKPPKTRVRLHELLAEKSPERPSLISESTDDCPDKANARTRNTIKTTQDSLIFKTRDARSAKSSSASGRLRSFEAGNRTSVGQSFPRPLEKVPSTARKEVRTVNETPLKYRPLHQLTINDFKINPTYNQGYNYAYNDVIRDRDQRRCLPNCTKPDCCGEKFRKMVEIGGLTGSGNGVSWASSSAVIEDADRRLLEDFLGADAWRLDNMDITERKELLTQAKAHKIANQYGKHRHFNQRAPSPPGFWRTDMPTTQEALADKEEARRLEREKVKERYGEAIRSGGRWLFRDD